MMPTKEESGRPGSNRRPEPWQGSALPTALRPRALQRAKSSAYDPNEPIRDYPEMAAKLG